MQIADENIGENFAWDVPATFKFSADTVDRWAEDSEQLALICVATTTVDGP